MEQRGLPLVMVGRTLYAMLPAMELAPLPAVESWADPGAAQEPLHSEFRLRNWHVILIASSTQAE